MTNKLILASSSPRRQELLKRVNIPFTYREHRADEAEVLSEDPEELVAKLATLKGKSTPILQAGEVILSADTVVSYEQRIFEKPDNVEDAKRMISSLSGNVHDVFSGVMIRSTTKEIVFIEQTKVHFWPLSEKLIESYIYTKEPYDKAGAYGIQSFGAMFVKEIIGDYYNVVGLPISRVVRELEEFSISPQI